MAAARFVNFRNQGILSPFFQNFAWCMAFKRHPAASTNQ